MANKTYKKTNKDSDLHHSNHNKYLGVSQSYDTEGALYKYRKSPIFSQKEQGRVVYCDRKSHAYDSWALERLGRQYHRYGVAWLVGSIKL